MNVTTVWKGKRAFTSEGPSGYAIGMDATAAYGGDSKGATPMELLLAGLGGCIGNRYYDDFGCLPGQNHRN
ncbi:putative OsmC-like protein [Paenibacillus sp. PvP094]